MSAVEDRLGALADRLRMAVRTEPAHAQQVAVILADALIAATTELAPPDAEWYLTEALEQLSIAEPAPAPSLRLVVSNP